MVRKMYCVYVVRMVWSSPCFSHCPKKFFFKKAFITSTNGPPFKLNPKDILWVLIEFLLLVVMTTHPTQRKYSNIF